MACKIELDYTYWAKYQQKFDIGTSIDYIIKYCKDARWDAVSKAMEVLEASFVKNAAIQQN